MAKQLDDYLAEVNYHDYSGYVPSTFALKMINFIKLCTDGKGEENESPIFHYQIMDKLGSKAKMIINLCFRNSGKTTINRRLIEYIAVYGGLDNFGDVNYMLYITDSEDNGVKSMRSSLETDFNNSSFLNKYIPKYKIIEDEWTFTNLNGKTLVVVARGATSGLRGGQRMGERPRIAILDDLIQSDEAAKSTAIRSSIENMIYKAVFNALHSTKRKIIWSGTPFNQSDPLYKAIGSGQWAVSAFPVCEKFDENTTKESVALAWADRFPFEEVESRFDFFRKEKKMDAFNQELMLRLMSDENRLILDDDIFWYAREIVVKNKEHYNFYITTDFATSEKESADYSVISVWAYNANRDWLWVDGVCARQTMDQNVEDVFRFVKLYNPLSVGVEISGQQGGFIAWLKKEMIQRNLYFNFAKNSGSAADGIKPNTNKMSRFMTIVPQFKMKKFGFPEEFREMPVMKELENELRYATPSGFKSTHDDFIDTISMLSFLDPIAPETEVIDTKPKEYNIWDSMVEEKPKNRSTVF